LRSKITLVLVALTEVLYLKKYKCFKMGLI
jgi:hypothetical protein